MTSTITPNVTLNHAPQVGEIISYGTDGYEFQGRVTWVSYSQEDNIYMVDTQRVEEGQEDFYSPSLFVAVNDVPEQAAETSDGMSAAEAIASVEEIDIKTPEQEIMAGLADGCIITTTMEDGCVISTCENGIPHLDATVIGRRGDKASVVMADAVRQHKVNVAALVNGERIA